MFAFLALLATAPLALAEELEAAPVEDGVEESVSSEPAIEEVTTAGLSASPAGARTQTADPVEQRLLQDPVHPEPTAEPASAGVFGSLWMWPLALLGLAGLGGVAYRSRMTDGVDSGIKVLSRAALSAKNSLAVIEVLGADGQMRRMLVGIGGGAPRLVADLTAPVAVAPVVVATPGEAVEASDVRASDVRASGVHEPGVAKTESVAVVEEEAAAQPKVRRRKRGAAAYEQEQEDAMRQQRLVAREQLLAQVLAERERENEREDVSSRKETWARNFEALLGQHSGSR
ncbi:MAG: hypothetical protein AAFV53_28095 [Myxococcota bacterium]